MKAPTDPKRDSASRKIRTIEQARDFVKRVKVCTIFASEKTGYPSLWEHVDLPDKQPGEKGWGDKMGAVWTWKNQLPADYPEEIYYGKVEGGLAVLMDMDYMADIHFPQAYQPLRKLTGLAQKVFDQIATEPWDTTTLRNMVIQETGCTKSRFDTALKSLQVSMNIVRLNDPSVERDTWVPFKELYLEVWTRYVDGDG